MEILMVFCKGEVLVSQKESLLKYSSK